MSDATIYPFEEFEIRIQAKDEREAWNKLLRITLRVDIPHCKMMNSDK